MKISFMEWFSDLSWFKKSFSGSPWGLRFFYDYNFGYSGHWWSFLVNFLVGLHSHGSKIIDDNGFSVRCVQD